MRKILIFLIFSIMMINPSSAALLTSSATPSSIFKCQPSIVAATFNDGGVVSVNALLTSTKAVAPMIPGSGRVIPETETTNITLAWNGTNWVGIFGDNSALLRGERSVSYLVNGVTSYPSSTTVFVYSDKCTGTSVTNYTQIITPMGNYTALLIRSDINLLTFSLYPYIQYWGYLFYFLVMATVVGVIYLKTQNITQPLTVGLLLLLVVAGTTVMPPSWRNGVIFIIALLITIIYYRLFTRE